MLTRFPKTLAAISLCFCLSFPFSLAPCGIAWAASDAFANNENQSNQGTFVFDEYGALSADAKRELERQGDFLAERYHMGTYLLVVPNIGSQQVRDYATGYYNSHHLGLGEKKSGILFLVAIDSRDYVTITYGDGIEAFTDYGVKSLEERILPSLKDDQWDDAGSAFYHRATYLLEYRAETGSSFDSDSDPVDRLLGLLFEIAIALGVAGAIAGGLSAMEYRKMKTARLKTEAADYVEQGSFKLASQNDWFVTSTMSVVPLPDDHNSSGGGSTVFSGGFGGSSGGKF
ncbi:TPM domain-containing protein [Gordonibacter sp. Marseille-P4307]|uniref:TPM domain-containing protein n=1 Tax=Gordonibacter sp. Marseille-P4307 TaxID=2161815 RepID=UPI000F52D9F8|nr:TPM domain-containing protein [Gordonibacter sp. Marseille-P4307]